jgi:hypothetical protein
VRATIALLAVPAGMTIFALPIRCVWNYTGRDRTEFSVRPGGRAPAEPLSDC